MTTVEDNIRNLIAERDDEWSRNDIQQLVEACQTRALTDQEHNILSEAQNTFARYSERISSLQGALEVERAVSRAGLSNVLSNADGAATARRSGWFDTDSGEDLQVRSGQSFGAHEVIAREGRSAEESGMGSDLGQWVRSAATTNASTNAIVPLSWASQIIDMARAESAVLNSGATVIAMKTGEVRVGRVLSDADAKFRAEGSTIPLSDPSFGSVTLKAKSLAAYTSATWEWLQDVDNAQSLILQSLAEATAAKIDLVGIYGGIVSPDPTGLDLPTDPNPRGVLAALQAQRPANVIGESATNGTTQTASAYYAEVLNTIGRVEDSNEKPNGLVWSTRLARQYDLATDTTGQPLQAPASVAAMRKQKSNRLPTYAKGSNTSTGDLVVGAWDQLLFGVRANPTIQVLTEKLADEGKVGFLLTWRGDFQLARPSAFAVHRGLKAAA